MTKILPLAVAFVSLCVSVPAAEKDKDKATADPNFDHINALTEKGKGSPVRLKGRDSISTRTTFQPPVEITIVGKRTPPTCASVTPPTK